MKDSSGKGKKKQKGTGDWETGTGQPRIVRKTLDSDPADTPPREVSVLPGGRGGKRESRHWKGKKIRKG